VAGIPITELIAKDRIDAIVPHRNGGAEIVNLLKTRGNAWPGGRRWSKGSPKTSARSSLRRVLKGEYGYNDPVGVPVKLGRNGLEQISRYADR
jgi:malate dehydrogenase